MGWFRPRFIPLPTLWPVTLGLVLGWLVLYYHQLDEVQQVVRSGLTLDFDITPFCHWLWTPFICSSLPYTSLTLKNPPFCRFPLVFSPILPTVHLSNCNHFSSLPHRHTITSLRTSCLSTVPLEFRYAACAVCMGAVGHVAYTNPTNGSCVVMRAVPLDCRAHTLYWNDSMFHPFR